MQLHKLKRDLFICGNFNIEVAQVWKSTFVRKLFQQYFCTEELKALKDAFITAVLLQNNIEPTRWSKKFPHEWNQAKILPDMSKKRDDSRCRLPYLRIPVVHAGKKIFRSQKYSVSLDLTPLAKTFVHARITLIFNFQ